MDAWTSESTAASIPPEGRVDMATAAAALQGFKEHLKPVETLADIVKGIEYVVGLAFNANRDNIVLIKKARPDWQRGKYNGPGGHIEAGETPIQAMAREFREECGVDIQDWRPLARLYLPSGDVVHFLTTAKNMNIRTCTDEPVNWFNVWAIVANDLPVIPNLLWLIPAAQDPGYPEIVIHMPPIDEARK